MVRAQGLSWVERKVVRAAAVCRLEGPLPGWLSPMVAGRWPPFPGRGPLHGRWLPPERVMREERR